MKQVLLLALATFAVARLGVAGSCGVGSLASYVALGAGGCTVGGDTLYNFKILSGISGGTAIAPGLVNLSISGGGLNPSLLISTSQTATGGTPLEAIFTYDISGPLFTSISTLLSGSSETVDGGVTGLINFCEGGNFGPDGLDGCTKANGGLLTLDGLQNSDMGTFAGVSLLNVTDDFIIDPGTAGTASAGSLTNSFTAVPEPFSTALAGIGLTLAGLMKVRAARAKQENKQRRVNS
jgi:hypothetical protein